MRGWPRALAACALTLACLSPALAGQSCEQRRVTSAQLDQALQLAQTVAARLERTDARAAILARVGSDVSGYGLRWTHAGLVYRADVGSPWRVLHKLNYCGRGTADLYLQGPGNFFLDDPHEWRAWLLLPTPEVQAQILTAVAAGGGQALDEPRYSMIAYPFAREFQNSNQWLLELLAMARDPVPAMDRATAQLRLRRTGYKPGKVTISPLQRLGASVARPNISFADHPLEDRLAGRYQLVTVESLEQYLRRNGWLVAQEEVRLPESAP